MEDQANGAPGSGMLATLMRAWAAGKTVARESIKPKPVTLEAYLLPQHTHHNRAEIERGEQCGCIQCLQMFPESEIQNWAGGGTTAICPRCGMTAVIGSGTGLKLTPELLQQARRMLFEGRGRRG